MAQAHSTVRRLVVGLLAAAALAGLGSALAAPPARATAATTASAATAATAAATAPTATSPAVKRFTQLIARRQALVFAFHPL